MRRASRVGLGHQALREVLDQRHRLVEAVGPEAAGGGETAEVHRIGAEFDAFLRLAVTHHQVADLGIERAVFTRGRSPYAYLAPLKANLFLSANAEDVRAALAAGFPAAHVYLESNLGDSHPDEVRIAFDGDAVLFADEAERVYQSQGLSAFQSHESDRATRPLPPGPFKPLLEALHRLQIADDTDKVPMKLRTALVTARSAPAHERAIRTLMDWNIDVDEAMFLGGMDKGPFLREFEPDFYFDDQTRHVRSAGEHVPAGHVPHGITNE